MSAILQTRASSVAEGTDPQVFNLRLRRTLDDHSDDHRLQAVFAALPGAVLVLDGRGRVVEANPAAAELFSRPLIGEFWRHVLQRDFGTRVDRGDLVAADGRRFSVATHPLGTAPGQILLLTDVTESRELQARLAHQDRLAEMGRMAASIAHQVRTPLATALLYVSQLDSPDIEPAQRSRFVQRMRGRLQHLEQMVRDLLMFARSGGFSCGVVDLAELLDSVADEIGPRVAAGGGQVRTLVHTGLRAWGNRDALRSCLLNLAENAAQACAEGLDLELSAVDQNDGELLIRVTDNGPGIDESLSERIFEPFFTTRSDGTGLGLPVVRNVLEAHGGSIRLRAGQRGSCFELRLPSPDRAPAEQIKAVGSMQ